MRKGGRGKIHIICYGWHCIASEKQFIVSRADLAGKLFSCLQPLSESHDPGKSPFVLDPFCNPSLQLVC